jgi:hypothetical protein
VSPRRQRVPNMPTVRRRRKMIDAVREGWSWKGIDPYEIVWTNAFGNVLVRDTVGRIWRITPEELSCAVIAESEGALATLLVDPSFFRDWHMQRLVTIAAGQLGPVDRDRCYCLKIPAVLGGSYEQNNLGTISRDELIRVAGAMARQIDSLRDGPRVRLKVVE